MLHEASPIRLNVELHPAPASGETDPLMVRGVWEQVQLAFGESQSACVMLDQGGRTYEFRVNARETVGYLAEIATLDDADEETGFRWVQSHVAAGTHPMRSRIEVSVATAEAAPGPPPLGVVGRFLQHLFLGMNLALPGSCNLFACRYPGVARPDPRPPNLSGATLESALCHARQVQWPPLNAVPFADVWAWMERVGVKDLAVAREPVHKALFTLLLVADVQTNDPTIILLVAQALEALLVEGRDNIGSILRQRLELVLGARAGGRNWFSKFYDLRSRIAHGDAPLLRPGSLYDIGENPEVEDHIADYFRPVDEAVAILLAVLQDLIRSGATKYRFTHHVARE